MSATLHDVRAAIAAFNDAVMDAHFEPVAAVAVAAAIPTELLLRCFGGWYRIAGGLDALGLTPCRCAAHPRGRLERRGRGAGPRSLCLGHGLRLVLPGRFVADYKAVVSGYAVAVRLGFASEPPAVEEHGRYRDLEALILSPECITVVHEAGDFELPVEG